MMDGGRMMKLFFESTDLADYLAESEIANYSHPALQKQIQEICGMANTDEEKARLAFQYARDAIKHSFDIDGEVITVNASDVLEKKEGICFAKSHLLVALLRGLGIPAGFCYQRVMRKGTPESGYGLHGLNAVYLPSRKVWFRVDPRGNKAGVHSEFNIEQEQLAYTLKAELGEVDYPFVFAKPPEEVLQSMLQSSDCHELFYRRPEVLNLL
jgi:transglutaminase-like putative cysteine protease